MDARALRRRIRWILGAALPLTLASGCCQRSHFARTVPEGAPPTVNTPASTEGDGGLSDGGNCRAFCFAHIPLGCTGDLELEACGQDAPVDGGAAVRCAWNSTSCPSGPFGGACGRRPRGVRFARERGARTVDRGDVLGPLFARMAALEGASVPAFVSLHRALRAHGAPERLLRASARAASDEVRHQRSMAALARAHGATVRDARVPPRRAQGLLSLAAENAAEGCVRETFGALLAAWQARHAGERAVRSAMRVIARDEARHAALAWQIEAWASPRLSERGRARVARARSQALDALQRELCVPVPAAWQRDAGMPSAVEALALFGRMREALWAGERGA